MTPNEFFHELFFLYFVHNSGYENVAKFLVEHNANVNAKESSGLTPYEVAKSFGKPLVNLFEKFF